MAYLIGGILYLAAGVAFATVPRQSKQLSLEGRASVTILWLPVMLYVMFS